MPFDKNGMWTDTSSQNLTADPETLSKIHHDMGRRMMTGFDAMQTMTDIGEVPDQLDQSSIMQALAISIGDKDLARALAEKRSPSEDSGPSGMNI